MATANSPAPAPDPSRRASLKIFQSVPCSHMRLRMRAPIAFAIWFAVSIPSSTSAQPMPAEPDPARVRWTFGPLLVNPRVALTNAGVDDNVFNEPDALGPVSDFTMTVTPAAAFT